MIEADKIPLFLKYMGSKREILNDIGEAVELLGPGPEWFCDLFAGTTVVSYAMSDRFNVISNDIQQYSSVFARTYFGSYDDYAGRISQVLSDILLAAEKHVEQLNEMYPFLKEMSCYSEDMSFEDFISSERLQQGLLHQEIVNEYVLFTRCYSGTYWSLEQCEWIDALRRVADEYKNDSLYDAILSSIIFAMSYSSQSTGHFAQFRKVTPQNYRNILLYRRRTIKELFARKFDEILMMKKEGEKHENVCMSSDYRECLRRVPRGSIVYADPPYSNVHYSRFYHAVETLVRYDYPAVKYNGRYRTDRHQSPFDQAKHVRDAFIELFKGVKASDSHLILSYSDNGMLSPDEIVGIGSQIMGQDYECTLCSKEYSHMKMGRAGEYKMDVNELLITFKRL